MRFTRTRAPGGHAPVSANVERNRYAELNISREAVFSSSSKG